MKLYECISFLILLIKNTTAVDVINEELANDLVYLANEAEMPQNNSTESSYELTNSQGMIY